MKIRTALTGRRYGIFGVILVAVLLGMLASQYAYAFRLIHIPYSDFKPIASNVYVSPSLHTDTHATLLNEIAAAKSKITDTFGEPEAHAIIIFTDNLQESEKLGTNAYGSMHTLFLSGLFVVIGPAGRNHNVIAHELVHAEIADRLGFITYTFRFPAWLNEGVATLIDNRIPLKRDALDQIGFEYIQSLSSLSQFHDIPEARLADHYQAAKFIASEIMQHHGSENFYTMLRRYKAGEPLDTVFSQNDLITPSNSSK